MVLMSGLRATGAYATVDDILMSILMSENCYDVGGMRLRCMNGHEHMVYTFLFVRYSIMAVA